MGSETNFSGVIADTLAAATFTGAVVGNATTATTAAALSGFQTLPAATAYVGAAAGTLAIVPGIGRASMTKADGAGAYTLAAPGASNVGKLLVIENGHATAHVVTVAGLAGGNTLTFTNVVGAAVLLYAVSATVWAALGLGGAVQSQVG